MATDVKNNKKKKFGKLKVILTAAVVVAVIFLVLATAAQKLGNLTLTAIATDVKAYFMSFSAGDGYPYSINSGDVKSIDLNNSNLFLLLKDKTTVLTPTAKEIMPQEHIYSSPVMKLKGSKAIVYDLNSGKYRIQTGSEIVAEFEEKNNLMSAAIGKGGNYAIGTYSDECQSVFKAFTKNRKQEYIYSFKTERIISIALSDNGKFAAVAVIGAENGSIYSKLFVFDFSKKEPISTFEYKNSTILQVDYVKGTNIAVICDNMRSFIKSNTNRQKNEDFQSNELCFYDVASNGSSALLLSKFGSESLSKLSFFTNSNREKFTLDFDNPVRDISTDGSYTAVLFDNVVKTYNSRGKQLGEICFDGDPVKVQIDSGKVYVLTSVGLNCYKTRGTTDERVTDGE